MVVSVFDENGEMVPNKVRVTWGRMENFKCVDYFQVIIDYILKVELRTFTQCFRHVSSKPNLKRHCTVINVKNNESN